jgi:catechol 2,3-dioxygenase-like lactoylglutathione lyase family enzyme
VTDTTYLATSIDCDDASRSAAFWATLLGWEVTYDGGGMAAVEGDGHTLYFAELEGYEAQGWPSDAKQFHLDLRDPDPAAATERAVSAGASVPDFQPGGDRWTVLLDPAGHPFCISRAP